METNDKRSPMRRRLKFTSVVLISQMLLIALAIAWLIHMIVIASYGAVYFLQRDPLLLWIEISIAALVTIFGGYVLAIQIRRLGERRKSDRDGSYNRRSR